MYLDRAKFITLFQGGSDLYRLFANGEDGFLFGNFGDLTRLFTTSTGMTQVAADADPVGLALEDSRWQKRSYADQVAQAAECVPDPTFSSATGWTLTSATISGGKLNVANASAADFGSVAGVLVAGATYLMTYTIDSISANGVSIKAGTVVGTARTAPGTYSELLVSNGADINFQTRFGGATVVIDNVSVKRVTGNHGLQATGTARPFYKPNSGKPYLSFDGSDDALVTPFKPTAALTLAVALRPTAGVLTSAMIGGGASGTSNRLSLGVGSGGVAARGWGNEGLGVAGNGAVDLRGSDHVLLLTGDATSVDLWADGGLVSSAAPSGSPGGGAGGIAVGCWNNNGTTTQFMTGFLYAALALNRRVTPAEIALITSRFRSTYQ